MLPPLWFMVIGTCGPVAIPTGRGTGPEPDSSLPLSHPTGGGLGGGAGRGHWKDRQAHQGELKGAVPTAPGLEGGWPLAVGAPALSLTHHLW